MKNYEQFALLCEHILQLNEASSISDLFVGRDGKHVPGSRELVKALHAQYRLPHDAVYHAIGKISWTDIKAHNQWIFFRGSKGIAALKTVNNGEYTLVAPRVHMNGEVIIDSMKESHGGRALAWIEDHTGSINRIYVSPSGTSYDKTKARQATKDADSRQASMPLSSATIAKKFSPMFAKLLTQTIADVKGMVAQRMKSGNYSAAKEQFDALIKMDAMLDELDAKKPLNKTFSELVGSAIACAAAYHYPDETQISRRVGLEIYLTHDAPKSKLIRDIAQGEMKKLGTVLSYFKQLLVYIS